MKTKLTWFELVLLAAPFFALAIYWNHLPERVPIHWNLRGEIDAWSGKNRGLFIVPLTALGLSALLHFLPWLDPKLRRTMGEESRMRAVLPILRIALIAFFDFVFFLQIAVSLGQKIAGGRILITATLILLVVLGNYLGNLRPNYFAGIRTPWTLENPETWRATHRLGGRLLFFGAFFFLIIPF